jgi:Holliday junction resolvase RusA-like endonuclease
MTYPSDKPFIAGKPFIATGRYAHLLIHGEPASKANSRKLVTIKGKTRFIKSDKARGYADDLAAQVGRMRQPFTGALRVTADIFYATWRPDLDESLILDGLQGKIFINDRQVVEKRIRRFIDRKFPRARILVEEVEHPEWSGR